MRFIDKVKTTYKVVADSATDPYTKKVVDGYIEASWKSEGFEIDVPAFVKGGGWEDTSWHNDDNASFTNIDLQIIVYIQNRGMSPRFGVFKQPMGVDGDWTDEPRVLLYEGDDEAAAKRAAYKGKNSL